MRTEDEMHELVVAKVAVHRRRRALLASAGGGVAVVLLLVAVAAGAASSGPDESVQAGEGDPTTTTEAPTTTTTEPDPTTSTTSTTTTAPPATTTTEAPPATDPAPTTTAPPVTDPPTTTTVPVWPAQQSSFTHGGATWAVYLAVAEDVRDPVFATVEGQAGAVGYVNIGPSDLGCDEGAAEALGYDLSAASYYAVALYFPTEQDAQRFVDLYEPEVLGVVLVGTYCMD